MDDRNRRTGILAGQLATLGEAFRARLARDRDQLAAEIAAIASGDDPAGALRRLEVTAHKLHGTAAMFGYEELGHAAGRCEAAARRARAEGLDAHASRALLESTLAPLRALIDAAVEQHDPPPPPRR